MRVHPTPNNIRVSETLVMKLGMYNKASVSISTADFMHHTISNMYQHFNLSGYYSGLATPSLGRV
jgi:hypothetical protein